MKKNCSYLWKRNKLFSAKFILAMRLTLFFMILGILTTSAKSYSQETNLKLNYKSTSIKQILKEIENGSNYDFVYSNNDFDVEREVDIKVSDASVEEVLNQLLEGTGMGYNMVDHIVIISPNKMSNFTKNGVQQKKTVTGTVTDQTGTPLPGVTVAIKSTTNGIITDFDGNFTLPNVSGDAVLIFSFVGMKTQEIKVTDQSVFNVTMEEDAIGIDEVIAIGYGTQRKSDITGAVSSVRMDDVSANASKSIASALQGRVAGVSIESNGGAPGAGLSITVRGLSTLGNNSPLYIVDGIALGGINSVNPNDIESIEILKDAATASIYGSRAANGVVIITSKSGKKNSAPRLEVDSWFGIQAIPKRVDLLNGEQWTKLMSDNVGGIPAYNGINTDWQDEVLQTASVAKTNLNFSGGSEHFTYNISTGYIKENGTILNTDFSKANFRIKTEYEKGRIRVGETVIIERSNSRNNPGGGDQSGGVLSSALAMPPTVPVYDETNELSGHGTRDDFMKNLSNPIARLETINNKNNSLWITANAFAEIRLIDQLKYKFSAGVSEGRGMSYVYTGIYNDGNKTNDTPDLDERTSLSNSWIIENTLNYNKEIGNHKIDLLAGYTTQKNSYRGFDASRRDLPVGQMC